MTATPLPTSNWKAWHAFGLPGGSIRALLAIGLAGTICAALLLCPERQIPYYLQNVMFIVLGHYFAARHRSQPAAEAGPPPLYLPRGAVRIVLTVGFLVVAVLLYRQDRLLAVSENPGVLSLFLVLGFLLGVVFTRLLALRGHRPMRLVEDLRALLSLAAALVLVFMVAGELNGLPSAGSAHELWESLARWRLQYVSAALVSFYFGSRS